MYVEIKENKLLSWCENPYLDYEFVDIDYNTFEPEKYAVIDGVLTDISNTPEYIAEQAQKAKEQANAEIQKQIDELDIKRIRAMAEPSQKTTNKSWLEFYTEQIQGLRAQLQE